MKRPRESRAVWQERVERWSTSGLSASDFADRAGVNPRTLQWWKACLMREQRRGVRQPSAAEVGRGSGKPAPVKIARRRRPSAELAGTEAVSFIELPSIGQPEARIEVHLLSGRRIFVPPTFDAEPLAKLVAMLEVRS